MTTHPAIKHLRELAKDKGYMYDDYEFMEQSSNALSTLLDCLETTMEVLRLINKDEQNHLNDYAGAILRQINKELDALLKEGV